MENTESKSAVIGTLSFPFGEQEFIAAYRAGRIARYQSYDSFISRLGVMVFGYVFLFTGIMVTTMWLLGIEGNKGPIPPLAVVINLGIAGVAGSALYTKIHGYRSHLKSMYRKSGLSGGKVRYQFTPLRIISENDRSQGSTDWSIPKRALEFRDGFLIDWGAWAGSWIPKYVLTDAFSADDLAELFRAKINKYLVIDRTAGLPEKSKHRREHAQES